MFSLLESRVILFFVVRPLNRNGLCAVPHPTPAASVWRLPRLRKSQHRIHRTFWKSYPIKVMTLVKIAWVAMRVCVCLLKGPLLQDKELISMVCVSDSINSEPRKHVSIETLLRSALWLFSAWHLRILSVGAGTQPANPEPSAYLEVQG